MSTGRLGAGDTAIQPTILNAKGDLIVATAADTPATLAVGSANQVLTVDSTTATGLKWATTSSTPTFVGCSVYKNATQSLSNATQTAVTWQVEDFDTDGFHSTVSNTSRMTVPTGKDGKYLITVSIGYAFNASGRRAINFYKNGSSYKSLFQVPPLGGSGSTVLTASCVLSLVATDYVEIYAYQDSGGSLNLNGASQDESAFAITYLGA